jgi:tRNA threonylcarbamoyladenosine biosynthesis protein TsaB
LPTLLAIDTAGENCSLALDRDGDIDLVLGARGRTHLEDVMPLVEGLLARHGIAPAACDAFAFAGGPGSFTGLRVACTLVQGLALGSGRPVVRIGHLEALMEAAGRAGHNAMDGATALGIVDARMDEAYWAVYRWSAAGWVAAVAPAVGGRAELMAALDRWRPAFCAGRAAWLQRYIPEGRTELRDAAVDAGVVARLARAAFDRGEVLPAEQALPLYVRDRVAQTVAQRHAARAERAS